MLLGNDIVDLRSRDAAGKFWDDRFLERVCSPEERACVAGSSNPDLVLWALWAGKESAFKVLRKLGLVDAFSPRAIAFPLDVRSRLAVSREFGALAGSLHIAGVDLVVGWEWNRDFVHCLSGWFRDGPLSADRLKNHCRHEVRAASEIVGGVLSTREGESVHSSASRQARLLAKHLLAREWEFENAEIVRERKESGFHPPVVYVRNRLAAGLDLSLSHDGRFVATAIRARP
jgi:phosphopantetheinyl transferase (holo-ACP synthase)